MNQSELLAEARRIAERPFIPMTHCEQTIVIAAILGLGVPGSERVLDIALEGLDELECGINHIRGELVHPDAPLDATSPVNEVAVTEYPAGVIQVALSGPVAEKVAEVIRYWEGNHAWLEDDPMSLPLRRLRENLEQGIAEDGIRLVDLCLQEHQKKMRKKADAEMEVGDPSA